ncbi:thiol-disulfide oxidoreductase DCC family protein [Rhodoflexus sp.]
MYRWESESVVLFDGACNLCNGIVNFLIDADRRGRLKFASLQSETGQEVLLRFGMDTTDLDTFVFYTDGKAYTRSRAAIEVARKLGGLWQIAYVGIMIPPFIRDGIYRWVAKNRYRWFGKRDACRMPTPELKTRFL